MKNQSFHPRKIRIQETQKPSYDELKTRTINALNKLGQQKFSMEPGGYSLDNWMKGVNMLLDEFEKEVGEGRLPPAYLEKRRQLNDYISRPVLTSSMDEEISEYRRKIADINGGMASERARIASRVTGLKDERSRCSADLAHERSAISNQAATKNSDSIFRRLLGGSSKPAAKDPEIRAKELQSRLDTLSSEIVEQQKLLRSIDEPSAESPYLAEWNELGSLQTRLDSLEGARLEKVHLVREREEITASIANEISTMSPPEPKPA